MRTAQEETRKLGKAIMETASETIAEGVIAAAGGGSKYRKETLDNLESIVRTIAHWFHLIGL